MTEVDPTNSREAVSTERLMVFEAVKAGLRDAARVEAGDKVLSGNIRRVIDYYRKVENQAELAVKIREFDDAILQLNGMIGQDDIDQDFYRDASALKMSLGGVHLPTLAELAHPDGDEVDVSYATVQETFREISDLTQKRRWSFPTDTITDSQLVAGLLVEGYGLLIKNNLGASDESDVAECFVRAFEEVLITTQPQSSLTADVIPWVMDEIDQFPPKIAVIVSQ